MEDDTKLSVSFSIADLHKIAESAEQMVLELKKQNDMAAVAAVQFRDIQLRFKQLVTKIAGPNAELDVVDVGVVPGPVEVPK